MKLRVIKPGDAPDTPTEEVSMPEAVEAMLRMCIADNPDVVFLAWETKGKIVSHSAPQSLILKNGFVNVMYDLMHEGEGSE